MRTINNIIDSLPTIIKKTITTISVLITVILSLIYLLLFAIQYSLAKKAEASSIIASGYYHGDAPFTDAFDRYFPLLIISIIVITCIWIFHALVKARCSQQNNNN